MTPATELRKVYLVRTSDGHLLHCEPHHFGTSGEWWRYRWSIIGPTRMLHVGPPVVKSRMAPEAIRAAIDDWWSSAKQWSLA